jgi:hypothetical protein
MVTLVPIVTWGITSQPHNHVGESSVMTLPVKILKKSRKFKEDESDVLMFANGIYSSASFVTSRISMLINL